MSETDTDMEAARKEILQGYEHLLRGLTHMGYGAAPALCDEEDLDPNFLDTADRATRGFLELVHSREHVEAAIKTMLETDFPLHDPACQADFCPSMKVSSPNLVAGLCPHHLLPVLYRISVAYIPKTHVLGISKISRIIGLVAGRPVLQETIGLRLCDIFHRQLESSGAAAYVEGWHMCCALRGTRHPEAAFITSELCGAFKAQPETRSEFMQIVLMNHKRLLLS